MPDTTYADLSADRELDEARRELRHANAAIGALKIVKEHTEALNSLGHVTDITMAGVREFVGDLFANDLDPARDKLQERVNDLLGERRSTSPYDRAHVGWSGGP